MAPRRPRKRHPHRPLILATLQTNLSPQEPNTTPLAADTAPPRLRPRRYHNSPPPGTIPTMDGVRSEKRANPASYPDHDVPRRGIWEVGGWVGFCMNGAGRDSAAFRKLLVEGEELVRLSLSVGLRRRVGMLVWFLSWYGIYRSSFSNCCTHVIGYTFAQARILLITSNLSHHLGSSTIL
jgi:hypothetical protein